MYITYNVYVYYIQYVCILNKMCMYIIYNMYVYIYIKYNVYVY